MDRDIEYMNSRNGRWVNWFLISLSLFAFVVLLSTDIENMIVAVIFGFPIFGIGSMLLSILIDKE